jgi:thiol-disulfide isomerase/thioredoxin
MNMNKILTFAAAALFAGSLTLTAAPKDWVGKELPALGVEYLSKAPELKGKPVIVEFWATWCPPCRTSIPHLNELNKKFKDKGLVIVGVTDEDKATVDDFQKKLPMDYSVALDKGGLGQKFGIQGIPHAFVVGKDGKILWEGHPMALKEAEIEKALK